MRAGRPWKAVRQQFLHLGVGLVDILRVAGEGSPAEGADAAAEERADVGRHEAGEGECILQALVLGDLADIVAVVEGGNARIPEGDHGFHMCLHGRACRGFDALRIALALGLGFFDGPADRQVSVAGIMRRGLVGDDVRARATGLHPAHQLGKDLRGIADQADGLRLAGLCPAIDQVQRLVQRLCLFVDIAGAQAKIDAGLVALHGQAAGARHDGGERLRSAHATQPAGQDPLALEAAAVVLASGFHEGFVGALHDALRADVDPRTGRHLAVHGQPLLIQLVEMIPGRPVGNEVGVGDQHARRILVGAEDADRLARLDEQRLVLVQRLQRRDDAVEILPGARRPADAAIDHQLVRVLGHIRVEVVHQHAQRRFGHPALGVEFCAARGADIADIVARIGHGRFPIAFSS